MKTPEKTKKGLECCGKKSASCDGCPYEIEFSAECLDDMHEDALAYIQRLEAQVPKWISAKEPPQEWKDANGTLINYLVYMPEYGVDVANYLQPANTWVCLGVQCKVTHWMPLPEPPMEETGHV